MGDEIKTIVEEWINYLKIELLYGNEDPLFPKTNVVQGKSKTFVPDGFKKEHWLTTSSIRNIFKQAFTNAGIRYFNPHSFRDTLASLGEKLCRSPEEFKAWSQNLGHEGVNVIKLSKKHLRLPKNCSEIASFNHKGLP